MDAERLAREINFSAVRSGGPGGQHANKVSSKVVLQFDLNHSTALTDQEKISATKNLSSRLTKDNILIMSCDESRSQHKNKEILTQRFLTLMEKALEKHRKRIPTKVSKSVKLKRLSAKKKLGNKKSLRRKPKLD